MALQSYYKYIIIGAGMHGLSTAYHLAIELKLKGRGSGKDVLVIDKGAIGAGYPIGGAGYIPQICAIFC